MPRSKRRAPARSAAALPWSASEVRSLAQRSSQAAKDIKTLITNSFGEVQEGVALANQAGAALDEVVASIKKAADVVADIAKASSEQAGGLAQIIERAVADRRSQSAELGAGRGKRRSRKDA